MQLSYDPRYNIAYIRFKDKSDTVETIQVSDEMFIDMTPDGMIYGIELLNANEQLKRENGGKFTIVNRATGSHNEMALDLL